jgi:hypothetical protein
MTPVRDYRKRVGAALDVMIEHTQRLAGPNARRKPEPQAMQHLIDIAPHIYNWCVDGARRLGYRLEYCQGPMLTEAELKTVERLAARLTR